MRKFLDRIGNVWIVIIITIISITLSLLITNFIAVLNQSTLDKATIITAIVAPAIIAPTASWYLVGLLIKIHRLEEEQRKLAAYDYLTGLMNRRSYFENSNILINQCAKNSLDLTVAVLDIDNFKSINDCYGHSGGDEVLKSLSELLKTITRSGDLVGRIGGEEFAITMLGIDLEETLFALERIRLAIEQNTIEYGTEKINYTVSIGVSKLHVISNENLEIIIKRADEALYRAKNNDKNGIEYA